MGSKNNYLSSDEWLRDNAEVSDLVETETETLETEFVRPEFYEDEWAI